MRGLPAEAPVVIRHDWRIGEMHVLADGDTNFVAICKTARCPDGSVIRRGQGGFHRFRRQYQCQGKWPRGFPCCLR